MEKVTQTIFSGAYFLHVAVIQSNMEKIITCHVNSLSFRYSWWLEKSLYSGSKWSLWWRIQEKNGEEHSGFQNGDLEISMITLYSSIVLYCIEPEMILHVNMYHCYHLPFLYRLHNELLDLDFKTLPMLSNVITVYCFLLVIFCGALQVRGTHAYNYTIQWQYS